MTTLFVSMLVYHTLSNSKMSEFFSNFFMMFIITTLVIHRFHNDLLYPHIFVKKCVMTTKICGINDNIILDFLLQYPF